MAMQKVHDELTKRRISYHNAKTERLRKNLKIAREDGAAKYYIGELEKQLGEALLIQDDNNVDLFSNIQFLQLAISQDRCVTSDKREELSYLKGKIEY